MKESTNQTLGAIIGLINALGDDLNNEKVNTTILEALSIIKEDQDPSTILETLRDIKDELVPDCKVCSHPCGRTDEIYMNDYPESIQQIALNIIQEHNTYTLLELYEKLVMLPYQ